MKIRTEFVTPEQVEAELLRLLPLLPPWRREKALSFYFARDRYLCAKSYLLLEAMAQEEFGLASLPPFSYGANGKPYWKEYPECHFNLSHCEAGVACAVGKEPVGIDVERLFFDRQLAEAVLAPAELAEVFRASSPAERFLIYWTQKESLLKLRGCGIGDDVRMLLVQQGHAVSFETRVYAEHGCVVTAAV